MNKLKQNTCKRCGHTWIPRVAISFVCPKCKKYTWNLERKPVKEDYTKKSV